MPQKNVNVPFPEKNNPQQPKHYFFMILFIVVVLAAIAFDVALNQAKSEEIPTCGDGTFYGKCSITKPYFCQDGNLVERASSCGCGEILTRSGESCVSEHSTGSKEANLKYFLDEEDSLSFIVYQGFADHISGISREIYYSETEIPQRSDFKLKSLDEEIQRQALLPLVVAIQNITDDRDDQVRIAISIVQNIPYGFSDRKISLVGQEVNYSRYPYEVLYDNEGVCGEKSALLAFLLREMGYGTAFFYHADENHEAVGLRCPIEQSLDRTGYCFIETTGPSIFTDSGIEYVGGIKLESEPQIIPISQGAAIGDGWKEYEDAELLNKIRNSYVPFENIRLNRLKEEYGLVEEYHPA